MGEGKEILETDEYGLGMMVDIWRLKVESGGGVGGVWSKGCQTLFTKNTYSNGSKRIGVLRVRVCEMREPRRVFIGFSGAK
nr:hypothetical protein [Tanacetum cinerariifolium]